MSDNFNPAMFVLARESAMKTQAEVAAFLGVTQSKVSKFESGHVQPTSAEVARLEFLLGEPPQFFYMEGRAEGPGSGCKSYAKGRKTALAGDRKRVLADVNKVRFRVARLLRGVNVTHPLPSVRVDIDSRDGDAESIADHVREAWRLPPGPIQNLTFFAEEAGMVVVRFPFGTDKVDAMSQIAQGCPPVICINSDLSGEHARWALAHEIGHLVMHFNGLGERAEDEADEFARQFLMPREDIYDEFEVGFDAHSAVAMKRKWKVSAKALVRRAHTLRVITDPQAKWLYIRMNQMGWSKREPLYVEPERPRAIRDVLLLRANSEGGSLANISLNEAAIREEKLRAIFLEEGRSVPPVN